MKTTPGPMRWDDFEISPSISPPVSVTSSADWSEPEEPSELLILESFFHVMELLPGFTKHQKSGLYYVQGEIDLDSFRDYTTFIGELTLGTESDSESRIATHVLVRIARLQDPDYILFPSLNRLRITRTSKYLDFLAMFLPSNLTTIELTAISDDDPHYSSVLSFLESAIDQAPRISTLILGPGRIQDEILHVSSKYSQLRRLEMRNVGVSMTDQLLRDIGSLRNLETIVLLDNGTSTYMRSPEIPAIPTISRRDLETDASRTCVVNPQISLSIQSLSPEPTVSHGQDATFVGTPVVDFTPFPALHTLEVNGGLNLIEALVIEISPSNLHTLSIDLTKNQRRKRKMDSKASTSFQLNIVRLLRRLIWGNHTLEFVSLQNDRDATFLLPSDLFKTLLRRPNMKYLEITGMGIDIEHHRLEEVMHSKLETLQLPVHSTEASLSFVELWHIAQNCPRLKSLRCRLRDFWDIPDPVPKSHGLEVLVLSVSNAKVQLDQQLLFKIARYLDSAFPNLKITEMYSKNGHNAEQWGLISDLVKVCQAVRGDERARARHPPMW